MAMYGAIEAGGTKWVCAVGRDPDTIMSRARIATETPQVTLGGALEFFREATETHGPIDAIGIASFGPVELRRHHPHYGFITTTPKPGWSQTEVAGAFASAFGVPIGFDTDVNGAALGEGRWGAARGLQTYVYVTVGTGIGGGSVVGGAVAPGMVHAEMGHLSVKRLDGDDFPGVCPFHGDCFEGMAAGPAVEARWGQKAETLSAEDRERAVTIEAHYLGAGFRNIVYALAPERIVFGGGISAMPGIIDATRRSLVTALGGYPGLPEHESPEFIVRPGLGDNAGIAGAFVLAELAINQP